MREREVESSEGEKIINEKYSKKSKDLPVIKRVVKQV